MEYRCVATSPTGFVQQLAVAYLAHGYWFYVQGCIPEHKDPTLIDEKLMSQYGIGVSRQSRTRRKAVGIANIHYIRFERTFVLLATHGHHPFYDDEAENIRDARKIPIKFMGYSISSKPGGYLRRVNRNLPAVRDQSRRVRVQIGREAYYALKAYFVELAVRRSAEYVAAELFSVPYEPYAPVRQQMLNILRMVNYARRSMGAETLSPQVLRYKRQIVSPFEPTRDLAVA